MSPKELRPGHPELVDPYVELVDSWAYARVRRGEITAMTASCLHYNIRTFARTVRVKPEELTGRDIDHWLEVCHLAPASARSRLSSLKQFCRWLVEEGYLAKDPTFGVKGPREPAGCRAACRTRRWTSCSIPARIPGRCWSCS